MQESEVGDLTFDLSSGLVPADETPVQIETHRIEHDTGTALVVRTAGEISLFTVDRLRTAVTAGFQNLRDNEILIIDLTPVTFLASHGLLALVDATQAAEQRGATLRIVVGHNRTVIRPIHVTELNHVLASFETIEDAVHSPT